MAQVKLHRYLSCDSYNRIEVWVAQTNAELASYRPVPALEQSSPQPIVFPRLSRTHLAHVRNKHRPPDSITREMNLEDLKSNLTTLKKERLDQKRPGNCGSILKMNPELATEKNQEQLLGRESRPNLPKLGRFEQPVASTTTDPAPTSYNAKKERYGYERRPRYRTKNDRYEYKDKKVRERNDRVSKRVKRPTNHTFHASNVPCDRLTLNHRGIQGIFQKGKASAPVKPGASGPIPELFGFDTPLTAWKLDSLPKLGFSESEFLGKSDASRICFSNKPTCKVGEESDSAEYPTTSAPKQSNVAIDTPSTARDYCSPQSLETVKRPPELEGKDRVLALDFSSGRALELHPKKLLGYYLNSPETVGTPTKPNKMVLDENRQCYTGLKERRGFQRRKYPSLSSGSKTITAKPLEGAKKVDTDEKERRMTEKFAASPSCDDMPLEKSVLPDADTDWQRVSVFNNGSSFIAATEDFDDGMILDGGLHDNHQTSKLQIGDDSGRSSSMVEISVFGEPLECHGRGATKPTGELDYEMVDIITVPEVMDCSDMENPICMEECVTNITHDTDIEDMETAWNMIAASAATTSGIQERAEPWLESRVRRSPGLNRTTTEDLNMDVFDGLGRFWQRQTFY